MTIDEISNLVAQRLLQGSMNHEEFANYYCFLGLKGYKCFHEYHFLEQTVGYKQFVTYFLEAYSKLVPKFTIEGLSSVSIIPDNWYSHFREDIDINVKRNGVKNGLEKYVQWERDTKKFLEDMSMQAFNIGQICLSEKIKEYALSVDEEIKCAEREWIDIKSTDYDMPTVIGRQDYLCKKYFKKMKKFAKRKELEHDKS